jgi:purine nucleosidase
MAAGKRPFLIDTDTASDDAVALMMALRDPSVSVEAITIVAGNVPLKHGTNNALFTVEHCGADVPVYAGLDKPLQRELRTAQFVHGEDGMSDIGIISHSRKLAGGHAVDAIIATARKFAGELTIVTLGPLTNLAAALTKAPEIADLIKRYVMMGGTSDGYGNVTPVAEFNIWCDPEAANIVFESGLPIEMTGWDISRKFAVISQQDEADLRASGSPSAILAMDINAAVEAFCLRQTKLDGFDFPDPAAMAVALDPSIVTLAKHVNIAVELGDGPAHAQTVVDYLGITGRLANTRAVQAIDREKFMTMLRAGLLVGAAA